MIVMKNIDWTEYETIVKPILESSEFQKRKTYPHHDQITVYDHSLAVSKVAYLWAKQWNLNYEAAAIAGLLHDFYSKPWQDNTEKKPLFERHGYVHAKEALENAYKYFPELITDEIADSILRHMFPLNVTPPKYKIGWIVTFSDKYVSLEVFKHPKTLHKLVGLGKKRGDKHE